MNVLHLTHSLEIGGRRNAIVNLAEGLSKHGIRNYACSITSNNNNRIEEFSHTNIVYIYSLDANKHNLSHIKNILKLLNNICIKNNIDLIHSHDAASQFLTAILSRKIYKLPHVHTFHRSLSTDTKGIKNKLRNFYANHHTDAITVGSNDRKNHFISHNPFIQKDKVTRIPFGIQTEKYAHSELHRHEIRNQLKLNSDDIILGSVGHFGMEKGIDNTLQAFSYIKNRPGTNNVKLIISGKGNEKETTYINNLTNKLNIENEVIFIGFHKDIERWYSCFDILIHSARTEAFGLVLVEAMAASLPIIANRVGGMIDIIEHGKSGYLVEPDNPKALANTTISLLNEPKLLIEFGKHGYSLAKHQYSLEKFSSSYYNLYNSLF